MYCSVFTGRNLVAKKNPRRPEYGESTMIQLFTYAFRFIIINIYLKQKNGGKLNEIMLQYNVIQCILRILLGH